MTRWTLERREGDILVEGLLEYLQGHSSLGKTDLERIKQLATDSVAR